MKNKQKNITIEKELYPNVIKNGYGNFDKCCMFCAGDFKKDVVDNDEFTIRISMWLDDLLIDYQEKGIGPDAYFLKLYYCPMCGKRLLEQEEHHDWANDNFNKN